MAKFGVGDREGEVNTGGTRGNNTPPASNGDPVVSALQDRLTTQSEAVSSASSGVEKAIAGAIQSTQAGTEAETQRIESQFGRAIGHEAGQGRDRIQNAVESQGGFATQLTGLRRLVETTDKNLNDLEQRKQELILQNNSAGAAQMSALQIKELEFKQASEQQVFQNLLAESSFGLQAKTLEESTRQFDLNFEHEGEKFQLTKDQQTFQEQQAMGAIALEFGLQMSETDTISSILDRAQATGIVDDRRAAELRQIEASINASNATAAKALKGLNVKKIDDMTAESLAKAYRSGRTDFLAGLEQEDLNLVLSKVQETEGTEREAVTIMAQTAADSEDFFNNISAMKKNLSETERTLVDNYAALVAAETDFNKGTTKDGVTSVGSIGKDMGIRRRDVLAATPTGITLAAFEFITGKDIEGIGQGN